MMTEQERAEYFEWQAKEQAERRAREQFLATCQQGDQVYVVGHRGNVNKVPVLIERTTKTQIILKGGLRFRREDGRKVGATTWDASVIYPYTPDVQARWDQEKALDQARRRVHAACVRVEDAYRRLDADTCTRIAQAIEDALDAQEVRQA